MDLGLFKAKASEAAGKAGFENWEIYARTGNTFSVRVNDQKLDEYKNSTFIGASFRGVKNGKMGYAYTEKLEEETVWELVSNAAENAILIDSKDPAILYPGSPEYPVCDSWSSAVENMSVEEKIALSFEMERRALAFDPRIVAADYCGMGDFGYEVSIANSYGLDISFRSNILYASLFVRAFENGKTKSVMKYWHGIDPGKFDIDELVENACGRAIRSLAATSVPTGAYPVVFTSKAAISFFNCFLAAFYAENAQKGFSLLKGKTGEQVAASIVNLRDDGICEASFGSQAFDSEGVPCFDKDVIKDGALVTLLYNMKSAAVEKVKSTGNGFKRGPSREVETLPVNLYMVPSDKPIEEAYGSYEKVLVVRSMMGLHSGANPVSGDFSLLVSEGELIEGKDSRPIEQLTIAGNFFQVLKDIEAIGNDLQFSIPEGAGTVGMPSFLAKGIKVSGEEA
ncbi:MAG: TldD/PmbA family protein [Clostridiales bacterium]|jgi:PmbA protein|nr:TldD/PmbA family protein [Clostridiales bacterium]MDR2750930.1 TldD/PmbA family protein [Clostridiales bacterium]